jgi:hypothetical protein
LRKRWVDIDIIRINPLAIKFSEFRTNRSHVGIFNVIKIRFIVWVLWWFVIILWSSLLTMVESGMGFGNLRVKDWYLFWFTYWAASGCGGSLRPFLSLGVERCMSLGNFRVKER